MIELDIDKLIKEITKAIEKAFKRFEYKDDLDYCFDCGCYHYPGNHKLKMEG